MRKTSIVLLALAPVVLYLGFWPVPIDPAPWDLAPPPAAEGIWAHNDRLSAMEILARGKVEGPEDLAWDAELGVLWSGLHDGRIVRISPDGAEVTTVANTGGVALGVDLAPDGSLVVADAFKGLLRVDRQSGELTTLSTEEGGRPYKFTDAPVVGQDGRVWFTDASDTYPQPQYMLDMLEHRPHGRLLVYDPASGQTNLVVDQLCFANGVALNPAEDAVLFNETGRARVMRYWISGPRAGQTEVVLDNLPGYPDNLTADLNGGYWAGLFAPRKAGLESLLRHPFLTKLVVRLPKALMPKADRVGMAVQFDDAGRVLRYLEDPSGQFSPVTNIEPVDEWLYLGSLHEAALARVRRP